MTSSDEARSAQAAEELTAAATHVTAAAQGLVTPGAPNDKLLARCKSIGQDWEPLATPTEYFALGGPGGKAALEDLGGLSPQGRAVGEASRTLARELIKNIFRRR